jgi:predicted methyltransferase
MMHTTESVAKAILEDLDNRGLLNGIDDVVLAEIGDEIEGNVANLGDVTTMECQTCAERGYDNTDYHRLHRAWCDSVAEIERLRAALQTVVDLAGDGILPDGHDMEDSRTLLMPEPAASQASSS